MSVSPRALSCVLNAALAVSLIGASVAKAQTATLAASGSHRATLQP
jgi:uncharacterized protein YejL (UPF0352 family)